MMNYQKKLQAWLNRRDELCCDICGATGKKLAMGSTHRTSFKPTTRCEEHMRELQQFYGFAAGVTYGADCGRSLKSQRATADDVWATALQQDAGWFVDNPHRSHRVRRTGAPEGGYVYGWVTLVRQIEPGDMMYIHLGPCEVSILDDDDFLFVLFEELKGPIDLPGKRPAGDFYDIVVRAAQISLFGGAA